MLLLAVLCVQTAFCEDDIDGRGIWVHPDMRTAIELQEMKNNTHSLLKTGPSEEPSDFIVEDGKKFFTGYKPTWEQYDGAKFRRSYEMPFAKAQTIPASFSYREKSFSPVRKQLCGDCWAQGGVSAFEMTVNFTDRLSRQFSVQDVIDCSGFGSCGGGQASMKHYEDGAALESDYPYKGRTGRCNKDVSRNEKSQRTFYLRGADGKFPVLQEIQTALLETGAMEVCGSAGALGSGGRQDRIRKGAINHCYALTGWVDGKSKGWLDAAYLEIKNSWGTGWGDGGYGYYPLAVGDGVHLKGSVIAEIQGSVYKDMVPPEPVHFVVENADWTFNVTVNPNEKYTPDSAKAMLEMAMPHVGKTVDSAKSVVDLTIKMLEKGAP